MSKFDDYYNILMEAYMNARINPNTEKSLRDLAVGAAAENGFIEICAKNGLLAETATREQERMHIDYVVTNRNGEPAWKDRPENKAVPPDIVNLVEVKNEKEGTSGGEFIAEIRNVAGKEGWMYGKAHYLATFDPNVRGFRMLNREKFKDRLEKEVDFFVADQYQGLTHIPLNRVTKKPVEIVRNKTLSKAKMFYMRGQDIVLYVPYTWVVLSTEFILTNPQ